MRHSKEKLLHDALRVCGEMRAFLEGKTLEDLQEDRGLQLIIERVFEILGEALYRLRNLNEAAFDRITNGHRIIGVRNILAHGYDAVEYVILWDAIRNDFPKLEEELENLL